jgi:hypothetical protein
MTRGINTPAQVITKGTEKGGPDMVEMTDLKKIYGRFKATTEQSNSGTTGSNIYVMVLIAEPSIFVVLL